MRQGLQCKSNFSQRQWKLWISHWLEHWFCSYRNQKWFTWCNMIEILLSQYLRKLRIWRYWNVILEISKNNCTLMNMPSLKKPQIWILSLKDFFKDVFEVLLLNFRTPFRIKVYAYYSLKLILNRLIYFRYQLEINP